MAAQEAERQRQEHAEHIRAALDSAFESLPGDHRFCIRRTEAVHHVAKTLGIRVVNNRLFREVAGVAQTLGWEPIKNGGRSLFRCVKSRTVPSDSALSISKSHRYDPRSPLRTP